MNFFKNVQNFACSFVYIGGFRGGAKGAAAPPLFSCIFKLFYDFALKIVLQNGVLIQSSETLMLLYFASRIRPQCCMLHVLKSEVFIQGVGGGWGTRPPLSDFFFDPPLV